MKLVSGMNASKEFLEGSNQPHLILRPPSGAWIPCELEILAFGAVIRHFANSALLCHNTILSHDTYIGGEKSSGNVSTHSDLLQSTSHGKQTIAQGIAHEDLFM
jgi:hypothetical protein